MQEQIPISCDCPDAGSAVRGVCGILLSSMTPARAPEFQSLAS